MILLIFTPILFYILGYALFDYFRYKHQIQVYEEAYGQELQRRIEIEKFNYKLFQYKIEQMDNISSTLLSLATRMRDDEKETAKEKRWY